MIPFLKLIRVTNLIIIACTYYSMRFCFFLTGGNFDSTINNEPLFFILLAVSTILTAAAGNIINDYYDIESDKINKPNKWIVGNSISQKRALFYYFSINSIAFFIAIVLSFAFKTHWFITLNLLTILVLWIYSLYLKKTILIGNLVVALLTASIALLSGMYFSICGYYQLNNQPILVPKNQEIINYITFWKNIFNHKGTFVCVFAIFSFLLNFAREIIKDIEDINGDKKLYASTLPISFGVHYSKLISVLIMSGIPILYLYLLFSYAPNIQTQHFIATFPIAIATIIALLIIVLIFFANTINQFKRINKLLKLAMISGILTPFYWYFF